MHFPEAFVQQIENAEHTGEVDHDLQDEVHGEQGSRLELGPVLDLQERVEAPLAFAELV